MSKSFDDYTFRRVLLHGYNFGRSCAELNMCDVPDWALELDALTEHDRENIADADIRTVPVLAKSWKCAAQTGFLTAALHNDRITPAILLPILVEGRDV